MPASLVPWPTITYNAAALAVIHAVIEGSTHALVPRVSSLAPRPMGVVFGLGTRLRVRMRITLENGVLRNEQPSGCAVIDNRDSIGIGNVVIYE